MASPPFLPDETKPADGDVVSQYPAVERTFRAIIETWLLVDHDTAGEHDKVTLPERGSDPSNVADTGFVYTKDDGGDTELFYEDDGGLVVQLTEDGGAGPGLAAFPQNTSMLFYQSAAPTGWTKDTNATLNNHALRVVTSTGWSGGSTGSNSFTSVFGSGKKAGNTTLTAAQSGVPAHRHGPSGGGSTGFRGHTTSGGFQNSAGSPDHGEPIMSLTANNATASAASAHQHDLVLDMKYISLIRAVKD